MGKHMIRNIKILSLVGITAKEYIHCLCSVLISPPTLSSSFTFQLLTPSKATSSKSRLSVYPMSYNKLFLLESQRKLAVEKLSLGWLAVYGSVPALLTPARFSASLLEVQGPSPCATKAMMLHTVQTLHRHAGDVCENSTHSVSPKANQQ